MAIKVGDLVAFLRLDKSGFTDGLKGAGAETSTLQKATDKSFKLIAKAAKVAFLAVSAAMVKSVVDATNFEKQMANIATMLSKSTMPMLGKFGKEILTASKAFGEGTKTLTKGLYDILSASIPADKAMGVLNTSLLAAKAGMTDTGVAADVITTLLNAYSLEAENAAYISDVLFATVKRGKVTFGELAGTMGTVATLGSKAGVSVEELGAMMAVLTRNGLSSERAATALRGAITGLLKPTQEASDIAKELGIEFGLSAIEAHGFEGVMDDLADLPADVLTKLFPNVRGLTAVITAASGMGDEMKIFTDILADGSPTMEAWEKQSGTMQVAWDRLKATLKAVSINMGNELLPTVKDIVDAFRQWLDENQDRFIKFAEDLLETITNLVKIIVEWKDVIFAAAVAIGSLMVAQKAVVAIKALNLAFTLGAGPIGLIIAGLTTLVWIITKVVQASKEFKEDQQILSEALKGTAKDIDTYSDAQEILNKKLAIAKKEYDNIADAVVNGIKLGEMQRIGKQNQINQIEKEIKIVEENKKARLAADTALELAAQKRAKAELEANIATQKRLLEEIEADETREQAARDAAAAERQRLAAVEGVMAAIREAQLSEEDRIKAHEIALRKLGIAEADIIEFLKIEYADYYKLKEAEEKKSTERAAEYKITIDGVAESELKLANDTLIRTKATGKQTKATEDATDANFDMAESFKNLKKEGSGWSDFLATSFTAAFESAFDITKTMSENIKSAVKDLFSVILKAIGQQLIIAAVGYALLFQWGKAAASVAGSIAAFTGAMLIEALEKGGLVGEKKRTIPGKDSGGLFQGKPGIDSNVVALTSGEYVVNKEATSKNMDTLEAINDDEGNGGITINPMPVLIQISDREVGRAIIEFLTEESDRGSFRLNPKVIRSNI